MKVFFLDRVHAVLQERLTKCGYTCVDAITLPIQNFLTYGKEVEGIVLRARILLNAETLQHFPNLKFIARSGSGLENIDISFCKEHQIQLFNSPEGNRNAVAEHALAMLLSLMNKFPQAQQQIKEGIWKREENRGEELSGKTVGIIGFGNNGSAFAQLLKSFNLRILAYDKYKTNFGNNHVQESTLDALFEHADVVSLHIPQTRETLGYVNTDFISSFAKPFYLLNLSRGKIVNTTDLVKAIKSEKVKGAGLDVLEFESKDFETMVDNSESLNYLRHSNNVILTPHVGGWTKESYYKLSDVLADKIIEYFAS